MKKIPLLITLTLFLCITLFAQNDYGRMSDKEKLIKYAKQLEDQPFGDDAKQIRAWALKYASDTKDVTVIICGGKPMEALFDKKNKFGGDGLMQYMIGMTAFKLSNPENKDENAAQYAGLLSTLKAYENATKEKPKMKHDSMEKMLADRENGELKKQVEAANCSKK